ncbi:MAG: response regulator transcription factor [Phycisphaerae bacterium]|nr:response regulator transcription factor [Phycisphaerae bacterium]
MDTRSTILIVEDETDLADLLRYHLEREGYVCRVAEDGERAVAEAYRQPPDLIILDRMLPKLSGDEVATRLKRDSRTTSVPILMLTAKAEDEDELVGFALGADDYVRKPFSVKLLLPRVAAILRRQQSGGSQDEIVTGGPITLDHARHEVSADGRRLDLTATEFRILAALMSARGRVLSREQLIDSAIGMDAAVTNRAMDVHIAALRKKLAKSATYIRTIRGVGYAFRGPEEES